jgi:hypothetical protein
MSLTVTDGRVERGAPAGVPSTQGVEKFGGGGVLFWHASTRLSSAESHHGEAFAVYASLWGLLIAAECVANNFRLQTSVRRRL